MRIRLLICVLFFSLFLGCKKKEEVISEPPPKPPAPMEVPPPKYETYQYLEMGRRDPFIPLIVEGAWEKKEEVVIIEEEKEEKTEEWILSGMIWDKNEKIAFIKTPTENYIFLNGMLFDKNNEPVSDIKAKIKDDGIIITKDKKERFLRMEERKIEEMKTE